jgi:hypothetical protein
MKSGQWLRPKKKANNKMKFKKDRRIEARKDHRAAVLIKKPESGSVFRSHMLNYSSRGLYFESNAMLYPNEEIDIGIDSSPYIEISNIYDCYRAKVQWRKNLPSDHFYKYGYGLMLSPVSNLPVFGLSRQRLWDNH